MGRSLKEKVGGDNGNRILGDVEFSTLELSDWWSFWTCRKFFYSEISSSILFNGCFKSLNDSVVSEMHIRK